MRLPVLNLETLTVELTDDPVFWFNRQRDVEAKIQLVLTIRIIDFGVDASKKQKHV